MYREEDQNGGERNFANAVTLLGSADWYSPGFREELRAFHKQVEICRSIMHNIAFGKYKQRRKHRDSMLTQLFILRLCHMFIRKPISCTNLLKTIDFTLRHRSLVQIGRVYRMCPVTLETALFFFDAYLASCLEANIKLDEREIQVGYTTSSGSSTAVDAFLSSFGVKSLF